MNSYIFVDGNTGDIIEIESKNKTEALKIIKNNTTVNIKKLILKHELINHIPKINKLIRVIISK